MTVAPSKVREAGDRKVRNSKGKYVVILFGALLLLFGVGMLYDSWNVSARFSQTSGVVTSYTSMSEGGGYFTVQFVNQRTGKLITTMYGGGLEQILFGPFQVGQTVDILYDPQDPTNIRINSIGLWFTPIFFMSIGGTFLIIVFLNERGHLTIVTSSS